MAEITDPRALAARKEVWVLMKTVGIKKARARFNATSLEAASVAVRHEIQANGYTTAECLGAVVFDREEWTKAIAWIHF